MSNRLEFTDPPWGILSDDDARAMAAGFDTAPEELKPWAAAKLIQHEAFRREYPKPVSAEEQADHRRRFNLLAGLAEDWDGTSAKQDAETQEALALKLAPDRDRARVLTWNKLFMARELGAAPEGTVVYETRRRQLAKGMFNGEGVGDDVEFFNAAKRHVLKKRDEMWLVEGNPDEKDTEKARRSLRNRAIAAAVLGRGWTEAFAQWQAENSTRSGYDPEGTERYATAARDTFEAVRERFEPLRPLAQEILSNLERSYGAQDSTRGLEVASGDESATLREMARKVAALPKEQRGILLANVALWADEKGYDRKGFFRQLGESFSRGFGDWIGGLSQDAQRNVFNKALERLNDSRVAAFQVPEDVADPMEVAAAIGNPRTSLAFGGAGNPEMRETTPEEREQAKAAAVEALDVLDFMAEIRDVGEGHVDPIREVSILPGFAERGLYSAARSAPYTLAAIIPYELGTALNYSAFTNANYQQLRREYGDRMSREDRMQIASTAALPQAIAERFMGRFMVGKMPSVTNWMQRYTVSPGMLTAKGAVRLAETGLAEWATENLQDFSLAATQDMFAALKEDVPSIDWDKWTADTFNWQKQGELLVAILPLALIGAGAGTAREIGVTHQILNDPAYALAAGIPQSQVDLMAGRMAAGDTLGAIEALNQTGGAAIDPTTPEARAAQAKLTTRLQQQAEAQAAQLAEFGITVTSNAGTWTVSDGTKEVTASTAAEAMGIAKSMAEEAGAQQDQPFFDMLAALEERRTSPTTEATTRIESRIDSVAERLIALEEGAKAAEAAGDTATADRLTRTADSLERRKAVMQAETPGVEIDWSKVAVEGQSELEAKEGVLRAVTEVVAGKSALVPLEERAEADVSAWLSGGEVTTESLYGMILDVQNATGDIYLHGYTFGEDAAQDLLALKEAYSAMTLAYATARGRDGAVAGAARSERATAGMDARRKLRAAQAQGVAPGLFARLERAWEFFKEVMRQAARINRARRRGELGEIESYLERSIGLEPQARHAREVEQEAGRMFGVADLARPGGPRAARNVDLRAFKERIKAGEVPELSSPDLGSSSPDLADDLGNEADWLAEADASQARTQAELDALGGGEASFSLSPSQAVPADSRAQIAETTPETEAHQFANATVVGPASFSIQAFHGTPHEVDEFRLANIGTGEGVQAYGWGLYFAQERAVGENYSERLSDNRYRVDGRLVDTTNNRAPTQENWIQAAHRAAAAITAESELRRLEREGLLDDPEDDFAEYITTLESLRDKRVERVNGNLYAVELDVEDVDLLDWDQPLSEQSEKVRAALEALGLSAERHVSGQQLYWGVRQQEYKRTGDAQGMTRLASERLAALGIPGIRFLDGGSRADGTGTYNYVIFDESKIRIVERNGEAADTGGASFSLTPIRGEDTVTHDVNAITSPRRVFREITGQGEDRGGGGLRSGGAKRRKHGRQLAGHADFVAWAERNGKILGPEVFEEVGQDTPGGGEHKVVFDEESGRFIKLTKPGLFGYNAEDAGAYLQRWALHNEAFNDDVRIEGIVTLPGEDTARAIISQPFYQGRDATIEEIRDYLQSKGWHPADDGFRWVHPVREIAAWDMHTSGNAIMTEAGVQVIDFVMSPASASELAAVREATGFGRETSFRLTPTATLDALSEVLGARMARDPEARRKMTAKARESLDRLKASWRDGGYTWDGEVIQPKTEHRSKKELDKEQAFRQAVRREELEDEAYAKHAAILEQPELAQAWNGPVMSHIADPAKGPLAGRLRSESAQRRLGHEIKGEYDGAEGLPRFIFGGSLDPDQMAQELFDAGLIREATPDAMWDAIRSELELAAKMKEFLSRAQADVRAARDQAKAEAQAWRAERQAEIAQDWSPKSVLVRNLRILDAILAAFPPGIRGKVGGWVKLAQLSTDAAMAKEIERRITKIDEELEKALVKEFTADLEKLLQRARPKKDKPGEAKRGKIGVRAHRIFRWAESYVALDEAGVAAERTRLDQREAELLDRSVPGVVNPRLIELEEQRRILDQVGGVLDPETVESARLEAALTMLEEIYAEGRHGWRMVEVARQEDVARMQRLMLARLAADAKITLPEWTEPAIDEAALAGLDPEAAEAELERQELLADAARQEFQAKFAAALAQAGTGSFGRRQAKLGQEQEKEIRTALEGGTLGLISFVQTLERMLGRDHPLVKRWNEAVRVAQNQKNDSLRAVSRRWEAAVRQAMGGKVTNLQARERQWKMATERNIEFTKMEGAKTTRLEIPIVVARRVVAGEMEASAAGLKPGEEIALSEQLEAFDALPDDTRGKAARKNLTIERHFPGVPERVKITEGQAMTWVLLSRQEQYQKNLEAHGFTLDALADVQAQITPEGHALIEHLAAEYRDNYEPLAKVFREMFGVDLPQVKNYSPFSADRSGDISDVPVPGQQSMQPEGGFRAGFLKTRQPNHLAEPKMGDAFFIYQGHMAATEHWRAFAPLVRELKAVLLEKNVRQAIEATQGTDMARAMSDWIKAFEQNGLKQRGSLLNASDGLARRASRNLARLALSWKVGTAVKNLVLPAFGTAKRIGWTNWWKGLARMAAGKVSYKEFREADFIQRRVDAGYSPEVRAALTRLQSEKPTRLRLLIEDGMQIHGKADALSTALGAAISFDHHFQGLVESGMPREHAQREALLLAEDDVRRTAQPVELAERSLTELSASDTGRILWMFSSDPRKNTALVIEAARHAYREGRAAGKGKVGAVLSAAAVKELRAVWVTSWIIDGLLNTLINTILRDLRDDDDDEWFDEKNWNPRNIVLGALFGPISGVPLLGELASGFDSGPLSTTFRGLASLATLAEALVTLDIPDQHENEPYEWLEKHLVNVLNGVGIFFRSDLASAANIGDQVFKYADGLFDTKTEAGAKELRKEDRQKREAKEAAQTDAMRAAKEAEAARRKEQKRREIEAAAERRRQGQ